jgi:hypothetical protein
LVSSGDAQLRYNVLHSPWFHYDRRPLPDDGLMVVTALICLTGSLLIELSSPICIYISFRA